MPRINNTLLVIFGTRVSVRFLIIFCIADPLTDVFTESFLDVKDKVNTQVLV